MAVGDTGYHRSFYSISGGFCALIIRPLCIHPGGKVGSVLLSVLLYGDFGDSRRHFRLGRVPTPSSQATTALPGQDSAFATDDDDNDIDD